MKKVVLLEDLGAEFNMKTQVRYFQPFLLRVFHYCPLKVWDKKGLHVPAWQFTEATEVCLCCPLPLPWCPWNAPVEIDIFLIGWPLPKRKCLGALALSKTKHTGHTHDEILPWTRINVGTYALIMCSDSWWNQITPFHSRSFHFYSVTVQKISLHTWRH